MWLHRLSLIVFAFFAVPASAQTQEQKNVMQHLAVLYVADKWCSEYSVSLNDINRAASSSKIRPDRSPFKEYLKSEVDRTQEALSGAGAKDGCEVIYTLYGPKGSAVASQMMRK